MKLLSNPKLQRLHRWNLGMGQLFHPTLYYDVITHPYCVSESDPRCPDKIDSEGKHFPNLFDASGDQKTVSVTDFWYHLLCHQCTYSEHAMTK